MILFNNKNQIYGALSDLVPFVQFKKREKHPWRSAKINTPPWVFLRFLKLYKCYQIAQRTTYLVWEKINFVKWTNFYVILF